MTSFDSCAHRAAEAMNPDHPVSMTSTGHSEVDAVLASLRGAEDIPLKDQVVRYTEAHQAFQRIFRTIDVT